LHLLLATLSTPIAAPVITGTRLRRGSAGSAKGAASFVAEAITTARAAGATGMLLARMDSVFDNHAVVSTCNRAGTPSDVIIFRGESTPLVEVISTPPPPTSTVGRISAKLLDLACLACIIIPSGDLAVGWLLTMAMSGRGAFFGGSGTGLHQSLIAAATYGDMQID
jgi:hypothetical protein